MKIFLLLSLIMLSLSCSQKKESQSHIIPRQKMETILWQLMQADEMVNLEALSDSAKNNSKSRIRLYQQVLDLNHVSKEAFKNSYQYYLARPETIKIMFDSITVRANRQRSAPYHPPAKLVN